MRQVILAGSAFQSPMAWQWKLCSSDTRLCSKEKYSCPTSGDTLRTHFNQRRVQVAILHIIFEKIKHLDGIQLEHDLSKRFNFERLKGIFAKFNFRISHNDTSCMR